MAGVPGNTTDNPLPSAADLKNAAVVPPVGTIRKRMTIGDAPFTSHANFMGQVVAAGFQPIVYIEIPFGAVETQDSWKQHIYQWVAAMRGVGVSLFEVGNEITGPHASVYWQRLADASPIIRAAGGRVIMSSAGTGWGPQGQNYYNMLKAANAQGSVWPFVDGIAIHIYAGEGGTTKTNASDPAAPASGSIDKLTQARTTMNSFASSYAKQLEFWVTEFGWATGPLNGTDKNLLICTSEAQQRDRLNNAFNGLLAGASDTKTRALCWFTDRDLSDQDDHFDFCGVKKWPINPGSDHKLSYAAISGIGDGVIDTNRPVITPGTATVTGTQSATVTATINPTSRPTHYFVQWGKSSGYEGGVSNVPATKINGASGVPVSISLTSLASGTIHYRMVAVNEAGTTYAPDATVNMGGGGGGTGGPTGVSAPIAGLTAGTTYYYRLVGSTSAGQVADGIRSFIASSPAAEPIQTFPPSVLPVDLTVEIETADGKYYLWDPNDLDPKNHPQQITFATSEGNGWAEMSCVLSRPIGLDYADLGLLDKIRLLGADASTVYEGRVSATPRSIGQDAEQITVEANGLMASARDRPMVEIYVDASAERWQAPSLALREALLNADDPLDADYTATVDTGSIHFKGNTGKSIPVGSSACVEYRAPDGAKVSSFAYRGTQRRNIGSVEGPKLVGSNDDGQDPAPTAVPGWAEHINLTLDASGDGTLAFATFVNPQPYALLRLAASGAHSPTQPTSRHYKRVATYGNHTVPLRDNGNDPPGVYASDVIADVIDRFCPLLRSDGLTQTSVLIPHLVFDSPTDPWDVMDAVNQYHGYMLGSYERGRVFFEPFDEDADPDWTVRSTDPGVDLSLAGETIDEFANGIVVIFTDLDQRQRILYPTGYPDLNATDLNNPANRWGTQKWTRVEISGVCNLKGALAIGAAALDDFNHPKAPGSLTLSGFGYILSGEGHLEPLWRVRYGQSISITDLVNDSPRRINSTTWNEEDLSLSLELEQPSKSVDAVLARYGAALSVRGIG